jgi:AraC-like DNA-binding protein
MQLRMIVRPICEPVELPIGASVIAERVTIPSGAPHLDRFLHFHDVAELVLFNHVRGEFIAEGRRHRLQDGAVVFVPSMRRHDFALGPGAMDWVLIQLDPYLVESVRLAVPRLARPFCATPDAPAQKRMTVLIDWLLDVVAQDSRSPEIERLTELLLLAAAEAPEHEPVSIGRPGVDVERLLPVLEILRAEPAKPLSLESAAAACRLSPAYFSRRFRKLFGMTFTEYARVYRLHLAGRRLVTTPSPVSQIAYGVGFSSPAHFAARFRERFGMTPREYRASARLRRDVRGEGSAK